MLTVKRVTWEDGRLVLRAGKCTPKTLAAVLLDQAIEACLNDIASSAFDGAKEATEGERRDVLVQAHKYAHRIRQQVLKAGLKGTDFAPR